MDKVKWHVRALLALKYYDSRLVTPRHPHELICICTKNMNRLFL